MLKKFQRNQQGFTFAEVVIATGIISVVLLMFGLMLISSANLQKSIFATQNADRVLSQETEQINSMRWDNLMVTPNPYDICDLDGQRFSNQSVAPGPTLFNRDGIDISIVRDVTWKDSGTKVECTLESKNKIEPKIITLTASWLERGETKSKTLQIVRSKWAEAPLETISIPAAGDVTLLYQDPLNNPGNWCVSYNSAGALVSGGTATSNSSSTLNLNFTTNNAICGIELQGLNVGEIYTVVAEVSVAENSSAITLSSNTSLLGTGIARPGGGVTRLTHSFVATGSSEIVGLIIPSHIDYLAETRAIITEFKVLN